MAMVIIRICFAFFCFKEKSDRKISFNFSFQWGVFVLFSLMKKEPKKSRLLNKFLKSTIPAGGFTQTPHCFKNVGYFYLYEEC